MDTSVAGAASIPAGLVPYFQEYDPAALNLQGDADLILQRTLEYGTWEEVRWLFGIYGARRGPSVCARARRAMVIEGRFQLLA